MNQKSGKAGTRAAAGRDDKARRLGEALRENLRRRKAQSRARAAEARAEDKGETPGTSDD